MTNAIEVFLVACARAGCDLLIFCSFARSPGRKKQLETRHAIHTRDAVPAIVQLHDRRHDRQPQPVGLRRALAGFVDAVKAFEQPGQVFGGDRLALVAHLQADAIGSGRGADE